jgi:membrane peptidoglycan carboxypeptidase
LYIDRIALPDGRVIFEDYAEREKAISDRTRFALEAILGSVVRGGTGQRIGRGLRIPLGRDSSVHVPVPAYGKTGTTNDYRNAAFLGFIAAPKAQGKGFDAASGYAIGAYTGFDDNTPMTRRGFRGTGASAAIPAWLEIAKTLVGIRDFSGRVDALDLEAMATGEAPMFQREKYRAYRVSRRTGLPLAGSDDEAGYAEDLSDELDAAQVAQEKNEGAVIWIRED